jgi:hypothetical protein
MNEAKIYSKKPTIIIVGSHHVKVTPPMNRWWVDAMGLFGPIIMAAVALQNPQDIAPSTLINLCRGSLLDVVDLVAQTTDKLPSIYWRRFAPARLRRRPGYYFIDHMTPDELIDFLLQWAQAIGGERIKKHFIEAVGKTKGAIAAAAATSPSSPASSTGSPQSTGIS